MIGTFWRASDLPWAIWPPLWP